MLAQTIRVLFNTVLPCLSSTSFVWLFLSPSLYNILVRLVWSLHAVCPNCSVSFQITKTDWLQAQQLSELCIVFFIMPFSTPDLVINLPTQLSDQDSCRNWLLEWWYACCIHTHTHTHNHFTALWNLSRTTWWAGTRRDIHPLTPIVVINRPLYASSIYYDPWHPSCHVYCISLLNHQFSASIIQYKMSTENKFIICPIAIA